MRVENGVHCGDTVEHMDFAYLAKVAKLNIAALAAIASAPPPPEPKVEGAVSTDTTVTWERNADAHFVIYWRRTDEAQWSHRLDAAPDCVAIAIGYRDRRTGKLSGPPAICSETLPHIRVDDWVFGVSSVSKDGFESPVASAVPGGAFKPYIAPEKK